MNEYGRVILHIGLHKTATSALQHQFFPACTDLNLMTTLIPNVKEFVSYVTRTDPIYFDRMKARELIDCVLHTAKPNMLSNESLSGLPYAGVIEGGLDHRSPILENLKNIFPDAKVILVLRRQDTLAKSLYRQYLKSGGTRTIKRFYGLGSPKHPPLFSLDRFLFSHYVDAVYESFPEGVLLLAFEDFVSNQSSILQKIVDFVGINMPDVQLRKENATSLGPLGMEITRLLNYIFRSHLNPAGFIPGFKTAQQGNERRISPVQLLHDKWPWKSNQSTHSEIEYIARKILDYAKNDNMHLDAKYGLDLTRFDYY